MDAGPMGGIPVRLCFLFSLMLFGFLVSLSEAAYLSSSEHQIDQLAEKGKKGARRLQRMARKGGLVLACLRGADLLLALLFSGFTVLAFAHRLAHWISGGFKEGFRPYSLLVCLCALALVAVCLLVYAVFCQLIPKKVAMQAPCKTAVRFSGFIRLITCCMKPFVVFSRGAANLFVRIFGLDPKADEEKVTEEEIRMLVDEGEEKGVLENTQRNMINNIFEFDDIRAGDIMTHRTDMEAVDIEDELQEVVDLAIKAGCSRIPVYKEDLDHIVGILYVKDLLKFIGAKLTKSETLERLLRPALFVPETMECGKLFSRMTEKRVQMAVIVDEYGGTAGLVTMEDLLESIVGSIQDEYDHEDEEVTKIDANTYNFDGVADIEALRQVTDVRLPEGDYDTVAGLVLTLLGYVPEAEETPVAVYRTLRFTVLHVEDKRIDKVKVELLQGDGETESAQDSSFQK